jgi:hypothetical protein
MGPDFPAFLAGPPLAIESCITGVIQMKQYKIFDADRHEVQAAVLMLVLSMSSIVAGLWQAYIA